MKNSIGKAFLLFCLAFPLSATNYYVIVAGLGGAQDYETQFSKWAADLDKQLEANGPETRVLALSGANATKQRVAETLRHVAGESSGEDAFALFLIGHGTYDGEEYKLNLPGPDITARELSGLINKVSAHRQLIVNMTSCSGATLEAFARKDRVVVTATKSGTEKNAPVFARYWVDALRDPVADTDKNGTVSALEAFTYAQHKTAAYFESEKLLATEHATMSDTAKVTGIRDPNTISGHGALAAAFPLVRPQTAFAIKGTAPEKQKLLTKKEDLEAKIDRLKYQKAAMSPEDYKQQLASLLLELARTQAEIDK